MNFDVSVIVITYNSSWEKLKETLYSVILQKDVSLEIIIADDGSRNRYDNELKELFIKNNFENYIIVNSEVNQGTVKNIYNGLQRSDGKYVKVISPGDMLYESNCLKNWIDFMNEHNIGVSFGDAVYYDNENVRIIEQSNQPAIKEVFAINQNRRKVFANHILADDSVLGASLMMNTKIMKHYMKKIIGQVVYAEDYMTKLMVYNSEKLVYYPQKVVWYEYGSGISTVKNSVWFERLLNDFNSINRIIFNENTGCDRIARKYCKYLHVIEEHPKFKKIIKIIYFPDVLYWKWKIKTSKNITAVDADIKFLQTIKFD